MRTLFFLLFFVCSPACFADDPVAFRFPDGSRFRGTLGNSEHDQTLAVTCDFSQGPFEVSTDWSFEADRIFAGVRQETSPFRMDADALSLLLDHHERIVGKPIAIDTDHVVIETRSLGQVAVPIERVVRVERAAAIRKRLHVHHLSRWKWKVQDGWRFDQQGLHGDKASTSVLGEVDLPERFSIQLVVECSGEADLQLILGDRSIDPAGQSRGLVRRTRALSPDEKLVTKLDWFGESISLVRSNSSVADVAALPNPDGSKRLELDLFVDQRTGSLAAVRQGELLGRVALQDESPVIRSAITFMTRGDPITIRRFELFPWDAGERPDTVAPPEQSISLVAMSFEELKTIQRGKTGRSLADSPPRLPEWVLMDGCRVYGEVERAGREETVRVADDVRAYEFKPEQLVRVVSSGESVGENGLWMLEGDFGAFSGMLLPMPAMDSPFRWQAGFARQPIQLKRDSKLRIHTDKMRQADSSPGELSASPSLQLRDGDLITGTFQSFQFNQAIFVGDGFGEKSIPEAEIAAIRLTAIPPMDNEQARHLMTVPRRQQGEPPIHLLLAPNGDAVRGRLLGMDTSAARIEIRSRIRVIPAAAVGAVMFLNADGEGDSKRAEQPFSVSSASGATLSLDAVSFDGQYVVGTHRLLGDFRLPVEQLHALQFGSDRSAPSLPWKLVPAKKPRDFSE